MNSLIETLNRLGGHFMDFAWPMFWQSSLLIALVWAVDFALARKIRASVRHALWLVVLVKLLLPPTLALPTGAAWWLFPAQPPIPAPTARSFTVTFDNPAALQAFISPAVPFAPPPPRLDLAGWTLLSAVAVSAGLLAWLLSRWAQVVRLVNRAASAPEFSRPVDEARRLAGLRGPVCIRAVESPMSPAVCGLFRPVVLLPRALAERLSADQLRAVLLHEIMHLRRRDIWVNCAQSLLQILYWWHPLVWVANARLRRVREEAVDDAVMLALDADAEIYAPTLLEVARVALRRPLLSLGLVGILESRSALRQRIERLMTFQAPRRAGLTLASLCGIGLFSAIALPMGEGPARAENETKSASADLAPTEATQRTNLPTVIVTAEIYQIPAEDLKTLASDLTFNRSQAKEDDWWSASPAAFSNLLSQLRKSGLRPLLRPRIQTSSGKEADFFVGDAMDGTELDCLPVVTDGLVNLALHGETVVASAAGGVTNRFHVSASMPNHGGLVFRVKNDPSNAVVCLNVEVLPNLPAARFQARPLPGTKPRAAETDSNSPVFTGPGRQAIMAKLGSIHFEKVSYDGLPLTEVLKQLSQQCKLRDPEGKGVNFLINPHTVLSGLNANPATTPTAGAASSDDPEVDIGSFIVNLPGLTDVRLADVLDAIVLVANPPIKYSIRDFAIVFSARDPRTPQQFARTFRVDPNTFYSGLDQVSANSFGAAQNSGSGSGQNQNNGAVVGVVNAFPGASGLRNTGQGAGGGSQGSGSLLNNTPTDGAGAGRLPQDTSVSKPVRPAAMTFRLTEPKPEAELKTLLTEAGVKMPPTTFIYNPQAGVFTVRGEPKQLALVHRLVLKLNGNSTQEIQSSELSFDLNLNPPAIEEATNLLMRTFRVDPYIFYSALTGADARGSGVLETNRVVRENATGTAYVTTQTSASSPSALAKAFFATLGVDLANPPGKAVFFNDGMGYLFVKATKSDLDTIERALQVLNQVPPEIHIKARFFEVPMGTVKDLGKYLNSTYSEGKPMGILTSQNATAARQTLQSRQGVEVLAEPEVTVSSGGQAQVRATQVVTIVTNLELVAEKNGSSSLRPDTNSVEIGPVLDLVPYVLADGYTIYLSAIPSVMEFLGYDVSTNGLSRLELSGDQVRPTVTIQNATGSAHEYVVGHKLLKIVTKIRTQRFVAAVKLWDGQTLVMGGQQMHGADQTLGLPPVNQEKELLIFITTTIVDPEGKRVHSDDEMPFARDGIPTQPQMPPQRKDSPPGP